MSVVLNDVHSQLNATRVAEAVRPRDLEALRAVIERARAAGLKISISGGRHAMGGQQFAEGSLNVDTTALVRVLASDSRGGLLTIEAGAQWPAIIAAAHAMDGAASQWGIRQKQTGVDAVTLGGSISANAHGRGLLMQPLGDDIEELTLVDPHGEVLTCSRVVNPELFSLVIGGYGLFGIIYSATLRLAPRQRVKRLVDIIDLDDAMNAVLRRASEGCLFGDFQFVIDANDESFLRRGVFACYRALSQPSDEALHEPSSEAPADGESTADLTQDAWLELLRLACKHAIRAFASFCS